MNIRNVLGLVSNTAGLSIFLLAVFSIGLFSNLTPATARGN